MSCILDSSEQGRLLHCIAHQGTGVSVKLVSRDLLYMCTCSGVALFHIKNMQPILAIPGSSSIHNSLSYVSSKYNLNSYEFPCNVALYGDTTHVQMCGSTSVIMTKISTR